MPAPSRYAVAADVVVTAESPSPSVLLIRRRNPPAGWAIPGGFVDPDEDLIDAARRELHEETGLNPPHLNNWRRSATPTATRVAAPSPSSMGRVCNTPFRRPPATTQPPPAGSRSTPFPTTSPSTTPPSWPRCYRNSRRTPANRRPHADGRCPSGCYCDSQFLPARWTVR